MRWPEGDGAAAMAGKAAADGEEAVEAEKAATAAGDGSRRQQAVAGGSRR